MGSEGTSAQHCATEQAASRGIRIHLCKGKGNDYGSGNPKHYAHAMVYRGGRIIASETGVDAAGAVRSARAFLRARRRAQKTATGLWGNPVAENALARRDQSPVRDA